jgi:hypothetical protein
MRSFVITTFALAVALAPAATFAQTPPQQPPAGQPPAGQPPAAAAPAAPAAPKLTFKTNAGLLLVQVKPDQTATFEEMFGKIKSGLAASSDADLKGQANSWHVYKSAEGMGGNALYVVTIDPVMPGNEYSFLQVLHKTLTPEQQRDPATAEMYTKYAAAIVTMNILNISPVGGGQ